MPGKTADAISLSQWSRRRQTLPVRIDHLQGAARELRQFRDCVARTSADQRASAREWGLACTSFMLRASMAIDSLTELTSIRVGNWPDTPWAARFRTAHAEVDRRLTEASTSARLLVRNESYTADVASGFGFEGARLIEALDGFCQLIEARYPAARDS